MHTEMQSTDEVAIRKAKLLLRHLRRQLVDESIERKGLGYWRESKREACAERREKRERCIPSGRRNKVKRRGSGRTKKRRVKAPGEVTHRPRPPHSPTHPDYPPPGAGRSVMSIEEVLNLRLLKFSWLLLAETQKSNKNSRHANKLKKKYNVRFKTEKKTKKI